MWGWNGRDGRRDHWSSPHRRRTQTWGYHWRDREFNWCLVDYKSLSRLRKTLRIRRIDRVSSYREVSCAGKSCRSWWGRRRERRRGRGRRDGNHSYWDNRAAWVAWAFERAPRSLSWCYFPTISSGAASTSTLFTHRHLKEQSENAFIIALLPNGVVKKQYERAVFAQTTPFHRWLASTWNVAQIRDRIENLRISQPQTIRWNTHKKRSQAKTTLYRGPWEYNKERVAWKYRWDGFSNPDESDNVFDSIQAFNEKASAYSGDAIRWDIFSLVSIRKLRKNDSTFRNRNEFEWQSETKQKQHWHVSQLRSKRVKIDCNDHPFAINHAYSYVPWSPNPYYNNDWV